MDQQQPQETIELGSYFRPLWQRKWIILAVTVAAGVATFLYYSAQPKQYTAGTKIFVQSSQLDQALFGTESTDQVSRDTTNQAILLESRSVAERVAKAIHYPGDPGALLGHVTATPSDTADFVAIAAQAGSPSAAARIANAFAQQFIALRSEAQRARIATAREATSKELTQLPRGGGGAVKASLQDRLRQLDAASAIPTGTAEQVDAATPPGFPSSPKLKRDTAFGALVGFLIGICLALLLDRIDRRIKRIDEIPELYGAELITTVPHIEETAPFVDGGIAIPHEVVEPFRALRTHLDLLALDQPLKTILVTSAVAGEGKTTTVRNLALAYREAGKQVAVIESDLRRPSFAHTFSISHKPGLTDVLVGAHSLEQALQAVAVRLPAATEVAVLEPAGGSNGDTVSVPSGPAIRMNGHGDLSALTCGSPAANPPSVLASQRLRQLIQQMSADFDVLLLDAAPLLAVSDTVAMLNAVDGVLIVSREGQATKEAALRVRQIMDRTSAVKLGVLANDVTGAEVERYNYGYGGHQPGL